jgi:hypothetical protein
MHDNIDFKQLDKFLERMMKTSTPLPSPPKTPVEKQREVGNDNLSKEMCLQIRCNAIFSLN